jgi:hypothetical protein
VRAPVFQPHACQPFVRPLPRLAARLAGDQDRQHHIFLGVEFRQQVVQLEHESHGLVAQFGKVFVAQAVQFASQNPG